MLFFKNAAFGSIEHKSKNTIICFYKNHDFWLSFIKFYIYFLRLTRLTSQEVSSDDSSHSDED